jgi:hypothetical protein
MIWKNNSIFFRQDERDNRIFYSDLLLLLPMYSSKLEQVKMGTSQSCNPVILLILSKINNLRSQKICAEKLQIIILGNRIKWQQLPQPKPKKPQHLKLHSYF